MLVLSRKQGQKLQIGNHITVTVLEVRGRVMRLGIEAPSAVRVLRGELADWREPRKAMTSSNRVAATAGS